jgi:hypothetical protein
MPPNSEIEKLERRWKENPKGTVFAPYAEVLRKHGDHALAREVLRQGLELHPDHIPGNIVLGRCCLDLGEDGPAEAAFTHVLELDGENVIALKALADITERQGRLAEASNWLGRLVAVDPSNDEARDQLTRVETAREAAAAVITGQITAQGGKAAPPPPEPAAAEERSASQAEVASGVIGESGEFRAPPPEPAPSALVSEEAAPTLEPIEAESVPAPAEVPFDQAETVPSFPVPPAPPRIHDLDTTELDLSAARDLPVEPVAGIEVDTPFTAPAEAEAPTLPTPMQAVPGLELTLAAEESHEIELRPSGASEFQAPDAASDLLDLKPGQSEFQVPDAAAELRIEPKGSSEYQTPSGAEELLALSSSAAEPAPEEPLLPVDSAATDEERPNWASTDYTPDLALTEAPTEEMSTRPGRFGEFEPPAPPPPLEFAPPAEEPAAPAAAAQEPSVGSTSEPAPFWEDEPASVESPAEPEPMEAEAELAAETIEEAPAEPAAPVAEIPAEVAADLPLIFPDQPPEPEPAPRRRVSEEALASAGNSGTAAAESEMAPAEPEPPEADAGEPTLVATETMAELYIRQGHLDEAAGVYRTLLARQPGDARLEARLRAVEAERQAGRRRHSFLASDTGGESVESFFRALASARPGSPGAGAQPAALGTNDGGHGEHPAPTRPASDPLSLSAIFGEDPGAQPRPVPPAPEPSGKPGADAFSFDQFFGATPGGGSGSTRLSGAHRDEDLDQFQHWLKSLKR